MWIRYTLSALTVLLAKVLTYLLSPILALPPFVVMRDESAAIGYSSPYPDKQREFLIKPLRWLQTHDAPLDEYYYTGYYKGKWTERFKHNKWFMRMCWLWRNPAYGVAHKLGYDQRGMILTKNRDEMYLRNTGINNISYYTSINEKGQKGFMYFSQIHYPFLKGKCLELYLGYKLTRKDPDKKCMLAVRVKPFKSVGK